MWLSFSTDRRKFHHTEGNRAYPIEKFSKKFRFPIPQEFSSGRRPAPAEVNKFIRECVTCLQAQEGVTLGTETLLMGAQVICTRVPILRDPKPPGFPKDKMFPYWVKYWHIYLHPLATYSTCFNKVLGHVILMCKWCTFKGIDRV